MSVLVRGFALDAPGGTVGPDTILPGSEQVLPALALLVALVAVVVAVVVLSVRFVRSRKGATLGRPVVASIAVVVAVLAAGCAWVMRPPAFFVPRFGPLPELLPADSGAASRWKLAAASDWPKALATTTSTFES